MEIRDERKEIIQGFVVGARVSPRELSVIPQVDKIAKREKDTDPIHMRYESYDTQPLTHSRPPYPIQQQYPGYKQLKRNDKHKDIN